MSRDLEYCYLLKLNFLNYIWSAQITIIMNLLLPEKTWTAVMALAFVAALKCKVSDLQLLHTPPLNRFKVHHKVP